MLPTELSTTRVLGAQKLLGGTFKDNTSNNRCKMKKCKLANEIWGTKALSLSPAFSQALC